MSPSLFSWRKGGAADHARLDRILVQSLSSKRIPSLRHLKYLSRLISKREYVVLKILVLIFLVNAGYLSWRFYQSATVIVPRAGGVYSEGLVGTPQYINPILVQENDVDRDFVRLVYSGLMTYGTGRTIVPDLSEHYELSKDERVYTFRVRPDVRWHDGEPLGVDDVVFTIEKIKDPAIKSPLFASFKDVKVERVDEYTVRFVLQKPFAPFLDLMTVGILPKHRWADTAPESFPLSSLNIKPVGSGPWKFKTLHKEKDGTIRSYTLARNQTYYREQSYIHQLVFKFYPDPDSTLQALKNRNVDGISFLPRELRDRLTKNTDFSYYIFQLPQYTALFFNEFNNPDLKSKAVRHALAHAIDKDSLVRDVLAGEGKIIHAPILEGFVGYDPTVKKYPFDLSAMASLLTTAGWQKDENGMWVKVEKPKIQKPLRARRKGRAQVQQEPPSAPKKHPLHVTLVTVNVPEYEKLTRLLKEQWVRAGVSVEVQLVDPSRLKSDIIDGRNYEAFVYGEIIGSDPDLYPFWHSSQVQSPGLNLSRFTNEKADAYLAQGREISDVKVRAQKYSAFQQILADEMPAIFLYNPQYNYVVSKKVKGIADHRHIVHPSDRLQDIHTWYIKSKRTWKK